jgi:hypothetical protein
MGPDLNIRQGAAPGSTILPILTSKNVPQWLSRMRITLTGVNAFEIATRREPRPPAANVDADAATKLATKKEIDHWDERSRKGLVIVASCLDADTFALLVTDDVVGVDQLWDRVITTYARPNGFTKGMLLEEFTRASMLPNEDVMTYVARLKALATNIRAANEPLTDYAVAVKLVNSLTREWRGLKEILMALPEEELTTELVIARLRTKQTIMSIERDEDERLESVAMAFSRAQPKGTHNKGASDRKPPSRHRPINNAAVTTSNEGAKRFEGKCFNCNKNGHIARDCRGGKRPSTRTNASAHTAAVGGGIDCAHLFTATTSEAATTKTGSVDWLIDSGASDHTSPSSSSMTDYVPSSGRRVIVGDGTALEVLGVGNVRLSISLGGDVSNVVVLRDVLHVPSITHSLFSVSHATRAGYDVVFNDKGCRFVTKEGVTAAVGFKEGRLFKLRASIANTSALASAAFPANCGDGSCADPTDSLLWHRRLGHANARAIHELRIRDGVTGLEGVATSPTAIGSDCEACVLGKLSVKALPKHSDSRATTPLELVHSDVVGPMSLEAIGSHARYYVSFIDDATRYTWTTPIAHKSDVLAAFKNFKSTAELQLGHRLKRLRTDNGGEYCNANMSYFLKSAGIIHERTAPNTPQQNGVAERSNRTLFESARSMLRQARLPNEYWAPAITAATYIRNRLPHKSLPDHGTPMEALLSIKPDVSNLRVFGCQALVHVPDQQRSKTDSKARNAVFIGYSEHTKDSYLFYNVETKKIFASRTAVFMENQFAPSIDNNYVQPSVVGIQPSASLRVPAEAPQAVAPPPTAPPSPAPSATEDEPELNDEDWGGGDIVEYEAAPPQVRDPARPVTPPLATRYPRRERHPVRRFDDVLYKAELELSASQHFEMEDYYAFSSSSVPDTISEALEQPGWRRAIEKEMESMVANDVFELVELPPGRKAVGCKTILKEKHGADGEVISLKARFVAKGYSQKFGVDYLETFAPTAKGTSIRIVLVIAADEDLELHHMDVATAFLNGTLDEELYMQQPEGTVVPGKEGLVWRLKKSIYGLKQSSRAWYQELDGFLLSLGFKRTVSDHSVYVKTDKGTYAIIVVYVDDLLLAANSEVMETIKNKLSTRFKMTDMGDARWLLGMAITRDRTNRLVTLSQAKFARDVLSRFEMTNCKPADTPMDAGCKLSLAMAPANKMEADYMQSVPYRAVIGSIMYLMVCTRPDLAASIGSLSQYLSNPGPQHWVAAKRVLRYLAGTINMELRLGGSTGGGLTLLGYADSDWAGDLDRRRSTSGYTFSLGKGAVSWLSKRQSAVALSTMEAEYIALGTAVREVLWLRALLSELDRPQASASTIFEDNQSCLAFTKNPTNHSRAKHIDIVHHFVRDVIDSGVIDVVYCRSEDMTADVLTKTLSKVLHQKCVSELGLRDVIRGGV